ncbi:MAG: low molecular weight phosphotyrosine protein phosphatase [Pirellulaceae bacterium]|nr:low molecular weight phosphotyrosine protein phosphatase [Pirellulaceae bacterium]
MESCKPKLGQARSLLFVCLGNICRSPAAEGVMQKLIDQRGLAERVRVDSAGTSSYHIGEPADRRMRAAAASRGYDLTSRARMIHRADFAKFDLIIAMDHANLRELLSYKESQAGCVRLLSDFLEPHWLREVPDPYFGGEQGFFEVLDMLEAACPAILTALDGQ